MSENNKPMELSAQELDTVAGLSLIHILTLPTIYSV